MIELSRISEAKKQIRLQAWTDMYWEFLASGKTIKAWCEENGIARTTFHNRLKQIREAALETTLNIYTEATREFKHAEVERLADFFNENENT